MTIDLVLATEGLTDLIIKCVIYSIEHKLDYCAIKMVFDILA